MVFTYPSYFNFNLSSVRHLWFGRYLTCQCDPEFSRCTLVLIVLWSCRFSFDGPDCLNQWSWPRSSSDTEALAAGVDVNLCVLRWQLLTNFTNPVPAARPAGLKPVQLSCESKWKRSDETATGQIDQDEQQDH